MLKITKVDTSTEQRLILEGHLTGPSVADVRPNWKELRHAYPERKFVVDLRGITRVDRDGANALVLMKREGAKFLATGLRVKRVLGGLKTKAPKTESQ
jgi:ABC-type transporter Mla MlaB component